MATPGYDKLFVASVDESRCRGCGFCTNIAYCPDPKACVGCGACIVACPFGVRSLRVDHAPRATVEIYVDGRSFAVPERITTRRALELSAHASIRDLSRSAQCGTGGCYGCDVLVDGIARRACVTPISAGLHISTSLPMETTPRRIIHGPGAHAVGGKGTPWHLKRGSAPIEVAIWAAGCNLRCPQCQNFATTCDGVSEPLTPREAAEQVTQARELHTVDRMAISGGEATLNRPWLVEYFSTLKALNSDGAARLHLDSNGTLLTEDYIDELLLEAGVTDIGIEPKAVEVETFQLISGVTDDELAKRYLDTSWKAIEHIVEFHRHRGVFLGVGMPYNEGLMSLEEVESYGRKLANLDASLQLCVLDYFPAFTRQTLRRPRPSEMLHVKEVLESVGLTTVVVQTDEGHFGPG